jgi:uncharacterized protein (DUF58 family)
LLILTIPLMAYLFAAILQRPEAIKLTVTREISPEYAPQGTPITVKLTVVNQGAAVDDGEREGCFARRRDENERHSLSGARLSPAQQDRVGVHG